MQEQRITLTDAWQPVAGCDYLATLDHGRGLTWLVSTSYDEASWDVTVNVVHNGEERAEYMGSISVTPDGTVYGQASWTDRTYDSVVDAWWALAMDVCWDITQFTYGNPDEWADFHHEEA